MGVLGQSGDHISSAKVVQYVLGLAQEVRIRLTVSAVTDATVHFLRVTDTALQSATPATQWMIHVSIQFTVGRGACPCGLTSMVSRRRRRSDAPKVRWRHVAGHGLKDDQSVLLTNCSSAGKTFLKVNANGVGPCASRWARRFLASSTPGTCPLGIHHKAV